MSFDLDLTEEQRQILDTAGAMLAERYPVARLHGAGEDNLSALAEFGAFALALPEESGGAGFTVVEEALLHVLLGRHLVSPSAPATSIAARIAAETGHETLAERAAAGDLQAACGMETEGGLIVAASAAPKYVVHERGGRLCLTDAAALALAPAKSADGAAILKGRSPDLANDRLLASEDTQAVWRLLLCAQLLGIAEATRDIAVEYALTREQFGRPIGSFQAIKHHCADMHLGAERLSALLDMASIALRDARDDAGFQVAALARIAPGIALSNARTCIQVHGGIGFSAESDPHLYLKRAHLLGLLCGRSDPLSHPAPMAPTRKEA